MKYSYRELMEAEDFYYRSEYGLFAAEKVVMVGGHKDKQALLNCYGLWVLVDVNDIYMPKDMGQDEWGEVVE